MGKFDGILICTDLDGTLYKNDKTVSKENREAIEFFNREGGYFTFITGRMPYYSLNVFEVIHPNVPFGCVNGGGLYSGSENRYIWRQEMPGEALELVGYIIERFPSVGVHLCGFDKTYFARTNSATKRFVEVTGIPNTLCDYRNFDLPMGKVIFCSDDENELLSVKNALSEHVLADKFDIIRSENILLELLPKGVNKALALKKLAEYLKLDERRTVAVGDYDNDVAMLRAAGCGIAVSNASKAALDAADFVTVSNEEHAIARVIYDIENGKYGI